jgi:hypothetical protein
MRKWAKISIGEEGVIEWGISRRALFSCSWSGRNPASTSPHSPDAKVINKNDGRLCLYTSAGMFVVKELVLTRRPGCRIRVTPIKQHRWNQLRLLFGNKFPMYPGFSLCLVSHGIVCVKSASPNDKLIQDQHVRE